MKVYREIEVSDMDYEVCVCNVYKDRVNHVYDNVKDMVRFVKTIRTKISKMKYTTMKTEIDYYAYMDRFTIFIIARPYYGESMVPVSETPGYQECITTIGMYDGKNHTSCFMRSPHKFKAGDIICD